MREFIGCAAARRRITRVLRGVKRQKRKNRIYKGAVMISEQTIQQAALALGEAAKPAQVILFGSYARGDAREDSDLDFLVIEPDLAAQKVTASFSVWCPAGRRLG
jgi:predicted nucleotidyltransferase